VLLQGELAKAAEESAALRQGNTEVAALQAQLAAAQDEANKLRNNSEEVEYLQAQLRRTLRQVVELQHQVTRQ
jgi:cysteine sulfinate desulfinase/cysteine desulfurase-like protein